MNKLFKSTIDYGIERGYRFIYRIPCINEYNEYIDMTLKHSDVNINAIWNDIKEVLEDQKSRTITLIFKR